MNNRNVGFAFLATWILICYLGFKLDTANKRLDAIEKAMQAPFPGASR